MPRTISATHARQQFFKLLEQAAKPGHNVTVTMEGEPRVVLMSVEEYEGWVETLEIMSDPELMQQIREGIADMKAGRVHTLEEVKRELLA